MIGWLGVGRDTDWVVEEGTPRVRVAHVQDRRIYHFTDHANLAGIVAAGGLYGDSRMMASGRVFTECAHEGVKNDRRARAVSCPPGGVVADYVPFYYAPRSPMMSAISNGKVAS